MKGGAVASHDADDGHGDARWLGSPAGARRDGGVEDDERGGMAQYIVASRAPVPEGPPVSAPPLMAAAATRPLGRRAVRHTTSPAPRAVPRLAVGHPTTAWLRALTPRQGGSPALPGAARSLATATRPESRVSRDAEPPSPTAPGGGTAAAASGPRALGLGEERPEVARQRVRVERLERDAEPLRPVLVDQHHVRRVLEVPARDVPGAAAVGEVGGVRVGVVGAGGRRRGLRRRAGSRTAASAAGCTPGWRGRTRRRRPRPPAPPCARPGAARSRSGSRPAAARRACRSGTAPAPFGNARRSSHSRARCGVSPIGSTLTM